LVGICIEITEEDYSYNEWAPSECYAACWFEDYTIVDCDDVDWGWEDECDCPQEDWESEGICVEIDLGALDTLGLGFDSLFITWAPNECYAACWFEEYTVVECDDLWTWEDECDCPEEDWESEGICVEVVYEDEVYTEWMPSECMAACWYEDFTVVECEDVWTWEDDCDCPEEEWDAEGICVEIYVGDLNIDGFEFDSILITWVPNECFAECWYGDYTVVECEDTWGWEDECDCPEEDFESDGICVEITYDGEVYIEWAPNECFAACWYEDYTVVDCDDLWGWEDECDCPDDDWSSEGFCIEVVESELDSLFGSDSLSFVTWVPSECFADCWYDEYNVVDCDWGIEGEGECDWDLECDCELDSEEGICISYAYGDELLIEWVPNECFADCWGFEDYEVVECEDFWVDEEDIEIIFGGDEACVLELLTGDLTTIQAFLLGLNECEAIELSDCVLDAPIFETDQEFIDYLAENCPEWFGELLDESDGPSLLRQFEEAQGGDVTNTNDVIENLDIKMLANPVVDQLDIKINATEYVQFKMTVSAMNGAVLNSENIVVNQGTEIYSVNTTGMASGTYLMTITSDKAVKTLKFMVVK